MQLALFMDYQKPGILTFSADSQSAPSSNLSNPLWFNRECTQQDAQCIMSVLSWLIHPPMLQRSENQSPPQNAAMDKSFYLFIYLFSPVLERKHIIVFT